MPMRWIAGAMGLAMALQGCSGHPRRGELHWRLSAQQKALADATCYGGVPIDRAKDAGPTELIVRRGYVLEHSDTDKLPLWVCERVAADQLTGHLRRRNRFLADPDIKGAKAEPNDYRGSGYDRGHQAPAGNQTVDPVLKDETFYMSNMAPQRPSLNRGLWKALEDRTRAWVMHYGHAYEWTGPIRCGADLFAAMGTLNSCRRTTIGADAVAVPIYFYKIVLVDDQPGWRAIAFLVPNADFTPPYRLEDYIVTIAQIEYDSGLEFMPDLPANERRALENELSPMWQ